MGGHVRMDKDLEDDPRVLYLTEKLLDHWKSLGIPGVLRDSMREGARNAALGGLYRLWRYADTHLKRGDLLNLALPGLAAVTGWPVTVLKEFPPHWLIEHHDGNTELPSYADKNALINKDNRREKTRLRVAAFRRRQRERLAEGNALPKPQGNTTERHSLVTTGTGSGTGTGPVPTVPGTGTAVTESREPHASPRGELASAEGRLARRHAPGKNGNGKPSKTPEELEHDIDQLLEAGVDLRAVTATLAQYGVTALQVTQRAANRNAAIAKDCKATEVPG